MDRKILVTGGSGMVGRNFREHPKAAEWTVFAPSHTELDLTDYGRTLKYLEDIQPDCIIHAAGVVGGIQANVAAPVRFLVANLDMGRNIVLAAREARVPRLINLGSSCMYPRDSTAPLREEQLGQGELEPTNEGYALAKVVTARLCQYIRAESGISYKTLIPCNLYGRYDKFSPATSHLVAALVHKLHCAKVKGESTIVTWGDGRSRREFMYAGDFADALVRAVETYDDLPDLLNIGVGNDRTIDEYYAAAAQVVGWKGDFVHDLSMPSGMKRKLLDVRRQSQWGWRPATSLGEGIARTYEFYLEEHA